MNSLKLVIAGGGPVGALTAVLMRDRGHSVTILERRRDPRTATRAEGRSINLVVTHRGFWALERVGLEHQVKAITVPVSGRLVHPPQGQHSFVPYGIASSDCNYSVSRGGLNCLLLSAAEERGADIQFESEVRDIDWDARVVNGVPFDLLIGTDGSGSAVRDSVLKANGGRAETRWLSHGYQELLIPAEVARDWKREALHLWARGDHFLMALPNLDGSFTGTLYLREQGLAPSFESVVTKEDYKNLFARSFGDLLDRHPRLVDDLARESPASQRSNPVGRLGTVRCAPWNLEDRCILLGDAAHAIVPFFGQGMNTGFEDLVILDDALQTGSLKEALERFTQTRKPDTDAIADLALENFEDMMIRAQDPVFIHRKSIESVLEKHDPSRYRSRYSIVMYSRIPFSVARKIGDIQNAILDELCPLTPDPSKLSFDHANHLIESKLLPFLNKAGVSLDFSGTNTKGSKR